MVNKSLSSNMAHYQTKALKKITPAKIGGLDENKSPVSFHLRGFKAFKQRITSSRYAL